jgi:SSS family solute:Na+ symporter
VGVLLSIGAAYVAHYYDNIMDLLQLVFGFVNAPLFATFLLGMFWKRTTGHGAFWGLVTGTVVASFTWCLTVAEGKGGILGNLHEFPSAMAQSWWIAMLAFTGCLLVTLAVSMATRPKAQKELEGLVYGLTKMPDTSGDVWYERPWPLAIGAIAILIVLNYWLF